MNARVRKEIRQLAPTWAAALVLVSLPLHWIAPGAAVHPGIAAGAADPIGAEFLKIAAFIVGLVFLSVSSFGREFTHSTFQLLMSQPVGRVRLWLEKAGVLAVAVASVWLVFLVTFFSGFGYATWTERMVFGGAFGIVAIGVASTGLWTTLVFRQVVPALCVAVVIPAVLGPLAGDVAYGAYPEWALVAVFVIFAFYSLCSYFFARWLFFRAQDLQPAILSAAWSGVGVRDADRAAGFRRRGTAWTLLAKEVRLQEVNALAGIGTFFVIGVLAVWFAVAKKNAAFLSLEMVFALACLYMPILAGTVAIAEERKLGTLDFQLGLPVSRRRQFLLKLLAVYGAALALGVVLPVLAGAVVAWLTGVLLAGGDLLDFTTGIFFGGGVVWSTVVLGIYAIFAATLGFYFSSLARNTPAALLGTTVALIALGIVLLMDPLPALLALGVVVGMAVFLSLSYANYLGPAKKFWSELEVAARTTARWATIALVLAAPAWILLDFAVGLKLQRSIDAWGKAGLETDLHHYLPPPAAPEENAVLVLDRIIDFEGLHEPRPRLPLEEREAARTVDRVPDEILSFLEEETVPQELLEELREAAEILDIETRVQVVREAVAYPRFDVGLDYDLGFELVVPHVWSMRHLARLLNAQAVLRAAEGRWKEAYEILAVSLQLGELLAEEPLLISTLTHLAIRDMALNRLSVFLRVHPPDDEDYVHWRELLTNLPPIGLMDAMTFDSAGSAFWMKRVVEAGEFRPSEFISDQGVKGYAEWLDNWLFRPMHKADVATLFDVNRRRIELARRTRDMDDPEAIRRQWNVFMEERLPWYAIAASEMRFSGLRIVEFGDVATARLELARTALAAHRYRVATGEWPGALEDLVPGHLPEVPRDPIDGEPLRYRRDDGRIVLYSIGPNRTDDGGLEVDRLSSDQPGDSVWVVHQ